MLATVKEDCGVYGIPTHNAGNTIEVQPFVGPYGDVCPDLFIDKQGLVWPVNLIVPRETHE